MYLRRLSGRTMSVACTFVDDGRWLPSEHHWETAVTTAVRLLANTCLATSLRGHSGICKHNIPHREQRCHRPSRWSTADIVTCQFSRRHPTLVLRNSIIYCLWSSSRIRLQITSAAQSVFLFSSLKEACWNSWIKTRPVHITEHGTGALFYLFYCKCGCCPSTLINPQIYLKIAASRSKTRIKRCKRRPSSAANDVWTVKQPSETPGGFSTVLVKKKKKKEMQDLERTRQ